MNEAGARQRAKLFSDVDELLAWKKQFELKQHDELVRQREEAKIMISMIEGGQATLEAISIVSESVGELAAEIGKLLERVAQLEMIGESRNLPITVCDNLPGADDDEKEG